jgi:hypothetical protein
LGINLQGRKETLLARPKDEKENDFGKSLLERNNSRRNRSVPRVKLITDRSTSGGAAAASSPSSSALDAPPRPAHATNLTLALFPTLQGVADSHKTTSIFFVKKLCLAKTNPQFSISEILLETRLRGSWQNLAGREVDEAVGLLTNENIFQGSEEPQQMQIREAAVEDCSTWSKINRLCKSGFQGTAQLRRKGNAVKLLVHIAQHGCLN